MSDQFIFTSRDLLNGQFGPAATGLDHEWGNASRSLFVLRTSGVVSTGDFINLQMSSPLTEFAINGANPEWITFYSYSGSSMFTGVGNYQNAVYLTSPIGRIRAVISGQSNTARFWLGASRANN